MRSILVYAHDFRDMFPLQGDAWLESGYMSVCLPTEAVESISNLFRMKVDSDPDLHSHLALQSRDFVSLATLQTTLEILAIASQLTSTRVGWQEHAFCGLVATHTTVNLKQDVRCFVWRAWIHGAEVVHASQVFQALALSFCRRNCAIAVDD